MSRNTGDLNTVLHEAAKVDDAKLVIELISQGAEVNALGKNNETPLHMAAARGHTAVVVLLFNRGASIGTSSKGGKTPLFMAAYGGHEKNIRLLLRKVLIFTFRRLMAEQQWIAL